tara:strand:- start:133 stop:588 length:456 start_codon:yes stop_codon:yes gene_type:complete
MGVQSKYHYAQKGRDPKDGGYDDEGDFHCWLVNKNTGDIIDPTGNGLPNQKRLICDIRKLDPTKPVYSEWSRNRELYYKKHIADLEKVPADYLESMMEREGREFGCWGCCNWNSVIALKQMLPEEADNWRVAIGSYGWKTRDGLSQWYEYG